MFAIHGPVLGGERKGRVQSLPNIILIPEIVIRTVLINRIDHPQRIVSRPWGRQDFVLAAPPAKQAGRFQCLHREGVCTSTIELGREGACPLSIDWCKKFALVFGCCGAPALPFRDALE